ncbi:MAG: ketopantoate reductase family protein [Lachnospiraceae bacterium]
MKVVVVGAGAMGCLYGGMLALSGCDVTMVDVNEQTLEKIKLHGIQVEDDTGTIRIAKTKACKYDEVRETPDLIILFTKTMFSRQALEECKGFIGSDTYVMSLQNGLGNEEIITQFVPKEHVIIGITSFPGDLKDKAEIRFHKTGSTKFCLCSSPENDIVKEIERVFEAAGLNPVISEHIFEEIWEKVALNASMNTITAVCRVPCGAIGDSEYGKLVVYHVLEEVIEVARAENINVSEDKINSYINMSMNEHKEHFPSMSQDVMNGRKTEIDSIAGTIVEKARIHGIKVPYIETMLCLVKTIENSYQYMRK